MFNADALEALLRNATEETIVHLEYDAGRPPTSRAKDEFKQAKDWHKSPHEYVGHFAGFKRTKHGELILTLFVHNRGEAGAYRAFNPNLGTIKAIRVVNAT